MNRADQQIKTYPVSNFEQIKQKVLNWAQPFSTFCFLDNHRYQIEPHGFECLLAAGSRRCIALQAGTALPQLQAFIDEKPSWLFGHMGYGLKDEVEDLHSSHINRTGFADLFFFEPEVIIRVSAAEFSIEAGNPDTVYSEILSADTCETTEPIVPEIKSRFSRDEYVEVIRQLQQHIARGDCYEINFCQEFFATAAKVSPLQLYKKLSTLSPNPFSAFYRTGDQWLLCASPERFLRREGSRILSQPIKGTAKRVHSDRQADEQQRRALYNSPKERAENVMVVDLVRNDLARICTEGTVKVDELYGIYSFPQVHQMISTISGDLQDAVSFSAIISACFPMGSMTGAPKKRVMQLIEQYERSHRGIFSGAVGYIKPGGDFDFNVVIRSIMYNAATEYISFQAGSGITHYSQPEAEWEECLLKAAAIKKVLGVKD